MANKPMKSIKLPNLDDVYTFTQVDSTLSTAGQAADAKAAGDQIAGVKRDFNSAFTFVKGKNRFNNVWHSGYYVNQLTGELGASDSKSYADYIEVTNQFVLSMSPFAQMQMAIYDENKDYIIGYRYDSASDMDVNSTLNIRYKAFSVANAKFIRFSIATTSISSISIQVENGEVATAYEAFSDHFELKTASLPNGYDTVLTDIVALENTDTDLRSSINPYGVSLVANKYINCNNGAVGINYSYSYATEDYISVAPLSKIDFINYASTSHTIESVIGLAFYDSANTFISGISYATYNSGIHTTVPSNATKMRITVYNADINNYLLRVDLTNSVLSDSDIYSLAPLKIIKETSGMLSIFHTVGCIGDSLASGESAYKDSGTTKYVDLYPFSWGQCLARMTGNTYYNFSRGGLSAKTWLTSEYATLAFDGNHKCDAYIIGLGQNDKNQGYTVGATSDINLSDYTQNADTFCGNYGKIIQMIKEHQPKAKIFVITDPLESVNTYGINTAIRNVAALFSNVYVLDFYLYGANYLTGGFLHNQYRSGHFNAIGYQYIARMIATYIDWYIMNNYSEFSQVEFIGTDYSW